VQKAEGGEAAKAHVEEKAAEAERRTHASVPPTTEEEKTWEDAVIAPPEAAVDKADVKQVGAPKSTLRAEPDGDEDPLPPTAGERKERDEREHLNLVFIGHVDAGKSTFCGQILYQTDQVLRSRTLLAAFCATWAPAGPLLATTPLVNCAGQVDARTIEKYEKEAKEKNRDSWFLAFIMVRRPYLFVANDNDTVAVLRAKTRQPMTLRLLGYLASGGRDATRHTLSLIPRSHCVSQFIPQTIEIILSPCPCSQDTNEEERAKGKTVEVGRAHFETSRKRYTILDAPGHKNYVPNMIAGACQVEMAAERGGCVVGDYACPIADRTGAGPLVFSPSFRRPMSACLSSRRARANSRRASSVAVRRVSTPFSQRRVASHSQMFASGGGGRNGLSYHAFWATSLSHHASRISRPHGQWRQHVKDVWLGKYLHATLCSSFRTDDPRPPPPPQYD
jgi:hypothetical protein